MTTPITRAELDAVSAILDMQLELERAKMRSLPVASPGQLRVHRSAHRAARQRIVDAMRDLADDHHVIIRQGVIDRDEDIVAAVDMSGVEGVLFTHTAGPDDSLRVFLPLDPLDLLDMLVESLGGVEKLVEDYGWDPENSHPQNISRISGLEVDLVLRLGEGQFEVRDLERPSDAMTIHCSEAVWVLG